MTSETLTSTVPDMIRRAAKLIDEHGWLMLHGETATQMGIPGIGITTAVRWAVRDDRCEARDLTDEESALVVEILECLEIRLGMAISLYERRHAGDTPQHVSHELRAVAWILGTDIEDLS